MDQLPYELQLQIFMHIDDVDSIENLILSSKRFSDIFTLDKEKIITNAIYLDEDNDEALIASAALNYLPGVKKYIESDLKSKTEALDIGIRNLNSDITKYISANITYHINHHYDIDTMYEYYFKLDYYGVIEYYFKKYDTNVDLIKFVGLNTGPDNEYFTITLSIINRRYEMFKYILDNIGKMRNINENDIASWLESAINNPNLEAIEYLVEVVAKKSNSIIDFNHLLNIATKYYGQHYNPGKHGDFKDYLEIVKYLVRIGNFDKNIILRRCIEADLLEFLKCIIEFNMNTINISKALKFATRNDRIEIVKYLWTKM
jgi:hypothetical protein